MPGNIIDGGFVHRGSLFDKISGEFKRDDQTEGQEKDDQTVQGDRSGNFEGSPPCGRRGSGQGKLVTVVGTGRRLFTFSGFLRALVIGSILAPPEANKGKQAIYCESHKKQKNKKNHDCGEHSHLQIHYFEKRNISKANHYSLGRRNMQRMSRKFGKPVCHAEAVRRAIQHSQENLIKLAHRYAGLSHRACPSIGYSATFAVDHNP
ncbi:MAG: hypothetical protein LBI68_07835 [Azoarcus sp.]|nr:hypothetical protein [Azoarcus sp.]